MAKHHPGGPWAQVAVLLWAAVLLVGSGGGATVGHQSSSIQGVAIDARSSAPVQAVVTLSGAAGLSRKISTTSQGAFRFDNVAAGQYSVTATAGGYLSGAFGRFAPTDKEAIVEVDEKAPTARLVVRLWKPGAISGVISDEKGEPLTGVTVNAFRQVGIRLSFASAGVGRTDDRGRYRIFSMHPGRYVVVVPSARLSYPSELRAGSPRTMASWFVRDVLVEQTNGLSVREGDAGSRLLYAMTFFGGATGVENATEIVLSSGEERSDVDVQLQPSMAVAVSGRVRGPDGPIALAVLRLIRQGVTSWGGLRGMESAITVTGRDGIFRFEGVTAGDYVIRGLREPMPASELLQRDIALAAIRRPPDYVPVTSTAKLKAPPSEPSFVVDERVTVATQDIELSIVARPAARISGSVKFEGSRPRPAFSDVRLAVSAESLDGSGADEMLPGWVSGIGDFVTYGVPPGRYILRVRGNVEGWHVRSAVVDGLDRLDHALSVGLSPVPNVTLVLSDRHPALVGTVVDGRGQPDSECDVLVFPDDPRLLTTGRVSPRRIARVKASSQGNFSITTLPPGQYQIVAVESSEDLVPWPTEAMLERLRRMASKIELPEGGVVRHSLVSVASPPR